MWGEAHVGSRLPNKTREGLFDDPVTSRNLDTEFSQQLQELSAKGEANNVEWRKAWDRTLARQLRCHELCWDPQNTAGYLAHRRRQSQHLNSPKEGFFMDTCPGHWRDESIPRHQKSGQIEPVSEVYLLESLLLDF